jgi:CheY-like chemotaxis protein
LKFVTDRKKFEGFINNLFRMVTRLTGQKKVYFSAYPVEDSSFIISVSDKFAQASTFLIESIKKLFVELKDPKDVGVSRFNFQITQSLLQSLNGSFVSFGDSKKRQECAFKFPLLLTKDELPEKLEFEIPDEIEVEEKISQKEPEHFVAGEEIEIEEEHVIEHHTFESNANETGGPKLEREVEPLVEQEISLEEVNHSHPPNHVDLSHLSCLYIEDQLDSQILFKVQMKGLKDVQFAASFEEALPLLDTNKFDFIVMDINLQGEYNGLDALKIIHQMPALEKVPVIAVTAYVLPGDREKFIATGFNDFISKPIFREKMLESLKKIFVN